MNNSTMAQCNIVFRILIFAGLLISLMAINLHAYMTTPTSGQDTLNKEATDYLSFYEKEDGKTVHWEVNFDKDKIASVYRDGQKVPEDKIDDYESIIYDKLNDMKHGLTNYRFKVDDFKIDMKKFQKDMEHLGEIMRDKFGTMEDFKIEFDDKQFKENMEKLHEELSELKHRKFELDFDSEEFKEQMKELKQNLKGHQLYLKDFDFNIEDFQIDMNKLKEELRDINIDLGHLDKDLGKLNLFIERLKSELVKDGYLKNINEDVEINFNHGGLEVNGEKVPGELFEKYKDLYKKYLGKELNDDNGISIH